MTGDQTRVVRKPPRIAPIPLFSDRPEERAVHFHFDALRDAIVGMLARTSNPTPFVFLVDGRWGSGKTSLMKTVITSLEPAVTRRLMTSATYPADDAGATNVDTLALRHLPLAAFEARVGSVCVRGSAGNAWEWTSTQWQRRGFGRRLRGEIDLEQKVSVRGGSFQEGRAWVGCACRAGGVARYGFVHRVFRCVRDESP